MDDHVSAINGSFLEKMFRAIVALAKSIHFAFKKIFPFKVDWLRFGR